MNEATDAEGGEGVVALGVRVEGVGWGEGMRVEEGGEAGNVGCECFGGGGVGFGEGGDRAEDWGPVAGRGVVGGGDVEGLLWLLVRSWANFCKGGRDGVELLTNGST